MKSPSDRLVLRAERPGALVRYKQPNHGFYWWCFAAGIALGIWLAQR
jgi:hypothetical protein